MSLLRLDYRRLWPDLGTLTFFPVCSKGSHGHIVGCTMEGSTCKETDGSGQQVSEGLEPNQQLCE